MDKPFEYYDKIINESVRSYNDAIDQAKQAGYGVKIILCSNNSSIYEYTISKRGRWNG